MTLCCDVSHVCLVGWGCVLRVEISFLSHVLLSPAAVFTWNRYSPPGKKQFKPEPSWSICVICPRSCCWRRQEYSHSGNVIKGQKRAGEEWAIDSLVWSGSGNSCNHLAWRLRYICFHHLWCSIHKSTYIQLLHMEGMPKCNQLLYTPHIKTQLWFL